MYTPSNPVAKHQGGQIHYWVFQQDSVWVDARGVEHFLQEMPDDYLHNVWDFIMDNASRIAPDDVTDEADTVEEHEILARRWLREQPFVVELSHLADVVSVKSRGR